MPVRQFLAVVACLAVLALPPGAWSLSSFNSSSFSFSSLSSLPPTTTTLTQPPYSLTYALAISLNSTYSDTAASGTATTSNTVSAHTTYDLAVSSPTALSNAGRVLVVRVSLARLSSAPLDFSLSSSSSLVASLDAPWAGVESPYAGVSVALVTGVCVVGSYTAERLVVLEGRDYELRANVSAPVLVPSVQGFGNDVTLASMAHGGGLVLAVGAPDWLNQVRGRVLVYQRAAAGDWTFTTELVRSDGLGGDEFGASVELASDAHLIAAGAVRHSATEDGAVYLFTPTVEGDPGTWTQAAKLDGPAADRYFGLQVALSVDASLLAVRAESRTYVYHRAAGAAPSTFTQVLQFSTADSFTPLATFPVAFSTDGTYVFSGTPRDDGAGTNSGAVYAYHATSDSSTSWELAGKFSAPGTVPDDAFGTSIATAEGLLLVGAPETDRAGNGTLFAYPIGGYCAAPGDCSLCPAGRWSAAVGASADTTCQACPQGRYQPFLGASKLADCLECPQGQYQDSTGSTECSQCDAGRFSSAVGATSDATCAPCSTGRYSTELGASSNATCQACAAGRFSTAEGASSSATCEECPAGRFENVTGSSECKECAAGKYSTSTAATSDATCQDCTAGRFSTSLGADSDTTCEACPAGRYETRSGSTECVKCGTGRYSASTAATSDAVCLGCDAGRFLNTTGALAAGECMPCPVGRYENQTGSSECDRCPAGRASSSTAAESITTCQACTQGRFSATPGASQCQGCELGRFSSTTGLTRCEPCGTGRYSNLTDGVSVTSCAACAPGRFSTATGAVSSTTCQECPQGRFEGDLGSSECDPCTAGRYSTAVGASSIDSCTLCTAGRFSAALGASSPAVCALCPRGRFEVDDGSSECDLCPAGRYEEGEGSTLCDACAAGKYYGGTGAEFEQDCAPCEAGQFNGQPGQSICTECPPGRFEDGRESLQCDQCGVGRYSPGTGAQQCDPCPAGSYCTESGLDVPLPCPVGSYCASPSEAPQSCAPGRFSAVANQTSCSACPSGTRAPSGSVSCVACPDSDRQTGSDDGFSCVASQDVEAYQGLVLVVVVLLWLTVPFMLMSAGLPPGDVATFCLSAANFGSDILYLVLQPFPDEMLLVALGLALLLPVLVANAFHLPRCRNRRSNWIPFRTALSCSTTFTNWFWTELPGWVVDKVWVYNPSEPEEEQPREGCGGAVYTALYSVAWALVTVVAYPLKALYAVVLVVVILIPATVLMFLFGHVLMVTKLLAVAEVSKRWWSWWHDKRIRGVIGAEFNKLLFVELLFHVLPQVALQVLNNADTEWTVISVVSAGLALLVVLNAVVRLIRGRSKGEVWWKIPVLSEEYYARRQKRRLHKYSCVCLGGTAHHAELGTGQGELVESISAVSLENLVRPSIQHKKRKRMSKKKRLRETIEGLNDFKPGLGNISEDHHDENAPQTAAEVPMYESVREDDHDDDDGSTSSSASSDSDASSDDVPPATAT